VAAEGAAMMWIGWARIATGSASGVRDALFDLTEKGELRLCSAQRHMARRSRSLQPSPIAVGCPLDPSFAANRPRMWCPERSRLR